MTPYLGPATGPDSSLRMVVRCGFGMMSLVIAALFLSGCDAPVNQAIPPDTPRPTSGGTDGPTPNAEPPQDLAPIFEGEVIPSRHYTVGVRIGRLVLPAASGGDGTLTYTLDPTPEGLSFDVATRTLTGIPTAENLYGVTYAVQDADGDRAARRFLISIAPTAPHCSPGEFTNTAGARWMIGDWDTSRPTSGDRDVGESERTTVVYVSQSLFAPWETFFSDTYENSWTNEGASDDRKVCQTQASGLYAVDGEIKIAIRRFDECRIWFFRERPRFGPRFAPVLLVNTRWSSCTTTSPA